MRFLQLLTPASSYGDTGYCVHVVETDGAEFDAEVISVDIDDGRYKLVLAESGDDADRGDPAKLHRLDFYDELERIEVL